ncbi:hypothetical protein FQN52_002020 [Onygenales sp. PD_12]|nr:hypothetical protein FQN52_002020 [Onygenales sp. PD_12]
MPTPKSTSRRSYRVGSPAERRYRKIACDLRRPICRNCDVADRKCQYGMRLNWPAQGDTRRALVADSAAAAERAVAFGKTYFINATEVDMGLFYLGGGKQDAADRLGRYVNSWKLPYYSLKASPIPLAGNEQEMVEFFMTTVLNALAPLRGDSQEIWKLFFQLSFSNNSEASKALIQAMVSLASLVRYGPGHDAARFKSAALASLVDSTKKEVIGSKEIYQHAAVGMLLREHETYFPTETSHQWPLYLSGSKRILRSLCLQGLPKLSETDLLALWVHYHDVLARFSVRHWRWDATVTSAVLQITEPVTKLVSPISEKMIIGTFGCSMEMMNLISRICALPPDTTALAKLSPKEQEEMSAIEHDLLTIEQESTQPHIPRTETETGIDLRSREIKLAAFYRLGMLIYFERVMRNNSGPSARVDGWAEEAFTILREIDLWARALPLFFVACEAHTEEQRAVILSLLTREQRREFQRPLDCFQRLIEAMWVRYDLYKDEGRQLNYAEALNSVTVMSNLLPAFA